MNATGHRESRIVNASDTSHRQRAQEVARENTREKMASSCTESTKSENQIEQTATGCAATDIYNH